MEATLVWAGTWTSITACILLLIPVILEFCKRNIPICFGILLTLTTIYTMTPYSPEAENAWNSITHYPEKVWYSLSSLGS